MSEHWRKSRKWHHSPPQPRVTGDSPGVDIGADDGANIAIVLHENGSIPETLAIARLIAAAPDLFEALEAVSVMPLGGDNKTWGMVEAALDKAKGLT